MCFFQEMVKYFVNYQLKIRNFVLSADGIQCYELCKGMKVVIGEATEKKINSGETMLAALREK